MNYKQIYFKHFEIGEQDTILCEVCHNTAVDIHHIIYKSRGGKDEIGNLISLCRHCHNQAHDEKLSVKQLQEYHNYNLD